MSADFLPGYLRKWRKRAGYTQATLAAELGISQGQVARWETGVKRIPLERFFEVAELYKITPAALMSDPDAPDLAELAERAADAGVTQAEIRAVIEAYVAARKKNIR